MDEHRVFICIDQKKEESKSLERQRKSNMTFSISTKFRKIVQENRVGILQDVLLWLTTSHDVNVWWKFYKIRHCKVDNLWCGSGLKHMITSHKCSILLSRYEGAMFLMKDIWIDDKSYIPYIPSAHFYVHRGVVYTTVTFEWAQ